MTDQEAKLTEALLTVTALADRVLDRQDTAEVAIRAEITEASELELYEARRGTERAHRQLGDQERKAEALQEAIEAHLVELREYADARGHAIKEHLHGIARRLDSAKRTAVNPPRRR